MFSQSSLIKSRILLSEIVSKKVQLKSKGSASYIGLCPFHQEKTPSFFINDERANYHCFGCQAHGDVFTFLMQYEGISYKEALNKLADIAGVELKKRNSKELLKIEKEKTFFQIYQKTAEFYHKQLFTQIGKEALNYIFERGIKAEIIKHYKLGFSPKNSSQLIDTLKREFSEDDLLASGIIQKKHNFVYDPFYNRLIFPIQDQYGKFIGFGGRVISHGYPKYLNSAENPIFQKSQHLYGYNLAKKNVHQQKEVIVVEGYMDVIALANQGIQNVVAPLGTSIKINQIEILWDSCSEPTICFDEDEAGQNAATKTAYDSLRHISHDKSLKFTRLIHGKDPDEVIKNKGVAFFLELIKKSIPLADYIFYNEASKFMLNTPERKILLKHNLEKITDQIYNSIIKKGYIQHFKNKYYKLLYSLSGEKSASNKKKFNTPKLSKSILTERKDQEKENVLNIISILHRYPVLLSDNKVIEELIAIDLPEYLDRIRGDLLSFSLRNVTELDNQSAQFIKSDNNVDKSLEELEYSNRYDSLEKARLNLFRAFDMKKIRVIKKELEQVRVQLLLAKDEKLMKKMLYLKECERQLKHRVSVY